MLGVIIRIGAVLLGAAISATATKVAFDAGADFGFHEGYAEGHTVGISVGQLKALRDVAAALRIEQGTPAEP